MAIATFKAADQSTVLDIADTGDVTITGDVSVTGSVTSTGGLNGGQLVLALGTATTTTLASLDYDTYIVTGSAASVEIYITNVGAAKTTRWISNSTITTLALKTPNAAAAASLTLEDGEGGHLTVYGTDTPSVVGWGVGAAT